ncbi:MAG: GlsB/YeaQ/YmgE family stress response membrane protein [Duganella sp.]
MNFIGWIIVGGLLGWIASKIMNTDAQQGIFLNVIVGIVGAFLGGLVISPLLGTGTINDGDFSLGSLGVSFLGAVVLLAIANLVFRGRAR